MFSCLTGLRFSDFWVIRSEDVRDKKLYKKQEKSDHWVVVPSREEAYAIFVYNLKRKIPRITNPDFNYYIKEVAKLACIDELMTFSYKRGIKDVAGMKPRYDRITSHTCRRSFCTNEFLAGTPVNLIMKISGHKKKATSIDISKFQQNKRPCKLNRFRVTVASKNRRGYAYIEKLKYFVRAIEWFSLDGMGVYLKYYRCWWLCHNNFISSIKALLMSTLIIFHERMTKMKRVALSNQSRTRLWKIWNCWQD